MTDPSDAGYLVWLAIYWWHDSEPAGGIDERDVWSAAGRLRIEYTALRPDDHADISLVSSFRAQYEAPDAGKDQRDKIEDAAAEYAASRAEAQLGIAWESSQSFPLTDVIDLLNGSAEWLRGLVEHPLTDIASAAGVEGPLVAVGAGITANFAMAQATAPIEGAIRICEIAGIVIGTATGAHPLVIACVKRLAHDQLGNVLARGFKRLLDPFGADREQTEGRDKHPRRRRIRSGHVRRVGHPGRGDRASRVTQADIVPPADITLTGFDDIDAPRGFRPGRSGSAGSTGRMPPTGRSGSAGSTGRMPPTGRSGSAGSTGRMPPTGRSGSAGSNPDRGGRQGRGR